MSTKTFPKTLLLSSCNGEPEDSGAFAVVYRGEEVRREESFEMLEESVNYLRRAWEALSPDETLVFWKSLGMLDVVRQGIRENFANERGLKIPTNPTEEEIREWLEQTRNLDQQHHGQNTIPSWQDLFG